MKRVFALIAALALCAVPACMLAGCGSSNAPAETPVVTIGTLATEDILPMWVAEEEGIFEENGVEATVTVFQSATELIAAVSAGEVDMAMTDPMVTASLYASGTDVQIEWVTLGTDCSQGRFGIQTADPSITTLEDLAGKPVGVGSNTILEYVMDQLMIDAGIPEDQIVTTELQKLPVRYQAMASGQVPAAALPGSLLALGEASGFTTIADDTTGANISQSVMIVRTGWLDEQSDPVAAMNAIKACWDQAVGNINDDPESYRALLTQKANLSEEIAQTYPICTYPLCQMPTQEQIDNVLTWMVGKEYLAAGISYDAQQGTFSGR